MMHESIGRVLIATLAAAIGCAIGVAMGKVSSRALQILIWFAAGTMLAITGLDMIPESFAVLGVAKLAAALGAGFLLVWSMTRHMGSTCPACSSVEHESVFGIQSCGTMWVMMLALSVHSALDGVGLVASDQLHQSPDFAMVCGLSIHKVIEGLALMLLLLGSGIRPWRATTYAIGVELFTLVGGIAEIVASGRISSLWSAGAVAFVGGGFIYLLVGAVLPGKLGKAPLQTRLVVTLAGFGATGVLLWISR